MEKIVPNFFDIQNLTDNTIVFSQTIGKKCRATIEYRAMHNNSIQLTIHFQELGGIENENYESNLEKS
jgi:hypothetical protein